MQHRNKDFDIILWGATSFVGKIIVKYLLQRLGINNKIRWSIAGRSQSKLQALKESLGDSANELTILYANANDEDSLLKLVSSTHVVISTVGPYLLYGEKIVAACVKNGTDYCDLTGEAAFVAIMQQRYRAEAEQTGARMIHCAGFDSIPSDLGVYLLNQYAQEKKQTYLKSATLTVTNMRGGFSGGTLASGIAQLDYYARNRNEAKRQDYPYLLCPSDKQLERKSAAQQAVLFDKNYQEYSIPFFMQAINIKVVHATNALLDYPYSKEFSYEERIIVQSRLGAYKQVFISAIFKFAMKFSLLRNYISKKMPIQPGHGPSELLQKSGFFKMHIIGQTHDSSKLSLYVHGDRDPGYGSTAKMISEMAICLYENNKLPGGFWTPASAFGNELATRLSQYAGVKFEIVQVQKNTNHTTETSKSLPVD